MDKPYHSPCDYIFANPKEKDVHFVSGTIDDDGQVLSIETNCGKSFNPDSKMFVRKYSNQDSVSKSSFCKRCIYDKICEIDQ